MDRSLSAGRFSAPWWGIALVLLACAGMVRLGIWQLDRAAGKQTLLDQFSRALEARPMTLHSDDAALEGEFRHVLVSGYFDAGRQLLLDNQSHEHVPGYRVWTPLKRDDGQLVMVDRGWLASGGQRRQLPDLSLLQTHQRVTVSGYWRQWPRPGLRLGPEDCLSSTVWPRLVQYPTYEEVSCLYPEALANGLLLMDAGLPEGYLRQWTAAPELSPDKHYLYAAQWFIFSATLIVLFIVINLKRKP
jgi:cytochrome oxidase assembly protein ShyY1